MPVNGQVERFSGAFWKDPPVNGSMSPTMRISMRYHRVHGFNQAYNQHREGVLGGVSSTATINERLNRLLKSFLDEGSK